MISFIVILFQVGACLGLGAAGLRVIGIGDGVPLRERLLYSFALGLGVLGWLIFFIGVGGGLNRAALMGLLGLASIGLIFLRPLVFARWNPQPVPIVLTLIGLLSIALFMDVLEALSPPGDADSLAYHFALPKQFLAAGRIEFVPRALDGAISLLVQMTYIPALGLGGERALTLWVLVSGWAAVYAVYVIARRHLGDAWSLALALVFATTPAVVYGAGSGQVEVRNLIFVVAAMLAVTDRDSSIGLNYSLLAGLLAGFFVGGKYMGLMFAASCGLGVLWRQRRLAPGMIYGIGVIVAGAQWYVWNAVHVGDPVFPMLFEWLGKADTPFWSAEHQAHMRTEYLPQFKGVPSNLFWLFAFPLKATLNGELAFSSGRTGLGPFAWLILPFAAAGVWKFRTAIRRSPLLIYGLVSLLFYVLWFFSGSPRFVRFLLPIYPLLLVMLGVAAARFTERSYLIRPVAAAVSLVIAIQLGGHGLFSLKAWEYVSGTGSRQDYLLKTVTAFQPVPWINANLSKDHRLLLTARHFLYYLDIPYIHAHPSQQAQVNLLPTATDAKLFLRQLRKLNVSHLLLSDSNSRSASSIEKFASKAETAGCFQLVKKFHVSAFSSRTLPTMRQTRGWMNLYRFAHNACEIS